MTCKVAAQKQRRNDALDSPFNLFALATALYTAAETRVWSFRQTQTLYPELKMASLGESVRLERGTPLTKHFLMHVTLRRLCKSRFLLLTPRCHFMRMD